MPETFHCPQCGYEGDENQVHGHIGAAHVRRRRPVHHGSVRGYWQHKRRKDPPCPACRLAWRIYVNGKRKK